MRIRWRSSWKGLMLLLLWTWTTRSYWVGYDVQEFLDFSEEWSLGITLFATGLLLIWDHNAIVYRGSGAFLPTASAAALGMTTFIIFREARIAEDETPTILYAVRQNHALDLRENGTYKWTHHSGFLSTSIVHRGRYRLEDSLVYLHNPDCESEYGRWVLRQVMPRPADGHWLVRLLSTRLDTSIQTRLYRPQSQDSFYLKVTGYLEH